MTHNEDIRSEVTRCRATSLLVAQWLLEYIVSLGELH